MKDGHVHTPFCPHGSGDSLKSYVERAIALGYTSMTFTEHAPLPNSFIDPVPDKDSAIALSQMENYLKAIDEIKTAYRDDLTILTGLEVDYIQGYEEEIRKFLDEYGPHLDDSILSVHFLKGETEWHCIDFNPEAFNRASRDLGGVQAIYKKYYEQVKHSAMADIGKYKPSRIGHISLVRKFHHLYPSPPGWNDMAEEILPVIKDREMALDYNGAGYKKEHCREPYPPSSIARKAFDLGIPLVYGSDAHTAAGLHAGREVMDERLFHSTD
ncbi:histidinol-phosphatase HisJ [Salimicrobium halophilum]|uniref:Histidinol-phosphatase n=1 Tax=Salimicrobium halophilum TaxID=86666 RepID=A0A1G8VIT7_9BACI|nr:histidinol-phosphatase HisJ [Salimicrobium halophilum]SDJ66046.1 histidinol-phosphate phosphatase [Salimicrobium halophilum]